MKKLKKPVRNIRKVMVYGNENCFAINCHCSR